MNLHNHNTIQFNNLFRVAQLIFGEAMDEWTFGGVESADRTSLNYYRGDGVVKIGINKLVIHNPQLYIFHLSHEVCHLLHPGDEYPGTASHSTLVINEGISTWFQLLIMQNNYHNAHLFAQELKEFAPLHYHAYLLVDKLLEHNTDAVKLLRKVQPRIDRLVADDFEKAGVLVPMELKRQLLEQFDKVEG
jgi:hypothetical protein